MIEEIQEYGNLKKVKHTLICPNCRIPLESNNIVLTTYPAQYQYYCKECNYQTTSSLIYPYTEIIGDPVCTYQQEIK